MQNMNNMRGYCLSLQSIYIPMKLSLPFLSNQAANKLYIVVVQHSRLCCIKDGTNTAADKRWVTG